MQSASGHNHVVYGPQVEKFAHLCIRYCRRCE